MFARHAQRRPAVPAWPTASMTALDPRTIVMAVALGLILEPGPIVIGSVVGTPFSWLLAPLGFVLAWAAVTLARQPDGELDAARGLRVLPSVLARLLALYALAALATVVFGILATAAIGLFFHDVVAGMVVVAATVTLLARFVYMIPSVAEGDDLPCALDRAWLLAHARGLPGFLAILALVALALGPPVLAAELSAGDPWPTPIVAPLIVLAATGPILMLGLERLRLWLEKAARRHDPLYARP